MTGSNPVPPKVSSFGRSGRSGSLSVDWWMVAIFAVAVLIRIPPLFASTLWYDDGVEGLMSQDVLRGRFPLFFYGQPAHGAADRYVAALALLVFGPTMHALQLAALGLFFVFLWSLAYTTRRIYGRVVAAIAALLVAVPPYYLFGWSFDTRGHYHLMLIFGAWALYLSWRIGQEDVWRSPERRFIGLGFLAGLAWWTNYLSITFLAPITVALGLQAIRHLPREWRPLLHRGLAAAGAFACGVAPLLGYYVGHGVSLLPPGTGASPETVESYLTQLIAQGLPQILGVHPRVWGPAYAAVYGVLAALCLAALVSAAAWWLRGRRQPAFDGGTVGPLLGLVVVTLLLSTLTAYGAIVRYPRYLLPLYLALPVLLGVAFQTLGRRSPAAMWLLVGAIALNNLLGSLVLSPVLSPHLITQRQRWQTDLAEQFEQLDRLRLNRVYGGSNLWPYLSDRRVLAAHSYSERMIELVQEVDAATRIGWLLRLPSEAFEQSAHAAGMRYRRLDGTGFVFYHDFELPRTGYADIDPSTWSARASPDDDAARAFDRQIPTAWRAGGNAGEPRFYQLDLGRPHLVGMLTWLPERWEELGAGFGLRVGLSLDARTWREVVAVPRYVGPLYWSGTHPFGRLRRSRVELRFPATEARHVRIDARAGAGWSIRELFVGTPVVDCHRAYDPAALTRWLLEAGVRFAYADHWLSANIVKESRGTIGVLPSNRSVNSYGLVASDPNTVETVRFRRDRAVVVEDCPPEVANAVGSLLRDSAVGFARRDVGGLVAFFDFREPQHPGARVPWRAEGPGGGTILVQLGAPRTVEHVVVRCDTPFVSPIPAGALGLETSDDTVTFADTPVRLLQPAKLRMSGSRLLRDAPATARLEFGPRRVRALRVVTRATGWEWCPIRTVHVGGGP